MYYLYEPTLQAVLDPDGVIQSHEPNFPTLFGHPDESKLEGARVVDFIPALKLPQVTQQITEEVRIYGKLLMYAISLFV